MVVVQMLARLLVSCNSVHIVNTAETDILNGLIMRIDSFAPRVSRRYRHAYIEANHFEVLYDTVLWAHYRIASPTHLPIALFLTTNLASSLSNSIYVLKQVCPTLTLTNHFNPLCPELTLYTHKPL